jgi:RNA polymerase sigma-70 factor (ECF subfamily)
LAGSRQEDPTVQGPHVPPTAAVTTPDTAPTRRRGPNVVDQDSIEWIAGLGPQSPHRQDTLIRLHALLLRAARAELARRAGRTGVTGPEIDDLAHQAADDAVLAILRRLPEFRGDSRFTTWAYKFAILEVSSKLGRHFWVGRPDVVTLEIEQWQQLPDRLGVTPESAAESADLLAAVQAAVETTLTERQRTVFVALVVDGVPLDALSLKLNTDRNAIYKVMFDARRKIRSALVTNGYLDDTGEDER